MEVGVDSFAAAFDENSRAVNPADRLRQLIEPIEHADEAGLDSFGVGEHHRREFLASAPAVILGAAHKIRRHREALGGFSRPSFMMNAALLPQIKTMRAIDPIGARIVPALHQEDSVETTDG